MLTKSRKEPPSYQLTHHPAGWGGGEADRLSPGLSGRRRGLAAALDSHPTGADPRARRSAGCSSPTGFRKQEQAPMSPMAAPFQILKV